MRSWLVLLAIAALDARPCRSSATITCCGSPPSSACTRCWRSRGTSSAGSPAIRRSPPPPSSASAPMRRPSCRCMVCRRSRPGAAPGLIAMLFAAFIGGAILHLRGHYFAIASLVIAEMLREIVNTTPNFTGGGMGLNLPIMRISVGGAGAVLLLRHAGAGRACAPRRRSWSSTASSASGCAASSRTRMPPMCSASTPTPTRPRRSRFRRCSSAWPARSTPPGCTTSSRPTCSTCCSRSNRWSWCCSAGIGTIFGPAIGALILLAFEEFVWRNFLTVHAAALGLIIVVLVLFLPNGILPLLRERFARAEGRA